MKFLRIVAGMSLLLTAGGCTTTRVTELVAPAPVADSNRRDVDQFVGQYRAADGRSWYATYGAEEALAVFNAEGLGGFELHRRRGDQFTATIDNQRQDVVAQRDTFGRVTGFRLTGPNGELTIDRAASPREAREIAYVSDGVVLVGTVYSPANRQGPLPAIVIAHGSGYSDRDSGFYQKLAFLLVDEGFIVLLPDKRGSGRSGGDWQQVGVDQLADDTLAGLEALRRYPGVDPARAGLLGVSQGGWVVPTATAKSRDVAFVIDLVGSTVRPEELIIHEITNTFRQRNMPEDRIAEMVALQRLGLDYIRTSDARDAEAYVREYDRLLTTDLAPIVREFPRDVNSPTVLFFRRIYGFDPIAQWRRVQVPALVVYGSEDEQDNVPVAESVRRLTAVGANRPERRLTVSVIDGTGHSLMDADRRDFHPRFKEVLHEWLRANVMRRS